MFADDLILLCKASRREVFHLKRCLELYCDCTGQQMNTTKSGLFFSANISKGRRLVFKQLFGLQEVQDDAFYLSNPPFIGKKKKKNTSF